MFYLLNKIKGLLKKIQIICVPKYIEKYLITVWFLYFPCNTYRGKYSEVRYSRPSSLIFFARKYGVKRIVIIKKVVPYFKGEG